MVKGQRQNKTSIFKSSLDRYQQVDLVADDCVMIYLKIRIYNYLKIFIRHTTLWCLVNKIVILIQESGVCWRCTKADGNAVNSISPREDYSQWCKLTDKNAESLESQIYECGD